MTLKECYAALDLAEGATLSEVKRAYRKLAFALHPDLNPDISDAAKRFQQVNEAYVTLSHSPLVAGTGRQKHADGAEKTDPRAREEAHKAYRAAQQTAGESPRQESSGEEANGTGEMLRDILNDPFARRVFEDIYSHMRLGRRDPSPGTTGSRNGRVPAFLCGKSVQRAEPDEKVVDRFKG